MKTPRTATRPVRTNLRAVARRSTARHIEKPRELPLQVVVPTERGNGASALRSLLQDAENVLLDLKADMYDRGDVAARICVFLAERAPIARR